MIQNVDLMTVAQQLAEYVQSDTRVNDFIYEQFGAKKLKVYIGEMLHHQIPRAEDTPYLVFFDWEKREGVDVEFCKYTCRIAIGVGCGARPEFVETDGGVLVLDAFDVSSKFTQLIIDVINDRKDRTRPLSSVEVQGTYAIDTDGSHWGTLIECTWRIYQTMGLNQEEF